MRHFKLNKRKIASLKTAQLLGRGSDNENPDTTNRTTAVSCDSIHLYTCLDCTNPNTTIGGHDPTNPGFDTTTNTR